MNPRLRAFLMLSFSLEIGLAVNPLTRLPAVAWGGVIAEVVGLAWGIFASEVGIMAYLVADGWLPFILTDSVLFLWIVVVAAMACVLVWAIIRGRLKAHAHIWASLRDEGVRS